MRSQVEIVLQAENVEINITCTIMTDIYWGILVNISNFLYDWQ